MLIFLHKATAMLLKFMRFKTLFLFAILTTALAGCSPQEIDEDLRYQRYSSDNFHDTLLNLDVAISEHNYRIIHRSTIGQAIRDRGDENFPLSTITEFCNITYAQEMMTINPDLINDMPCRIAVRETPQGTLVSTTLMKTSVNKPKQRAFAIRVNQNLVNIIDETIDF